jgi:hypothetical protein
LLSEIDVTTGPDAFKAGTSRALRRGMLVAALLLLSGCGSMAPTAAPPPDGITARFVPGGPVNVITVTAADPLPLRSAELVGPQGLTEPAYSIDVTANPTDVSTPGAGAFAAAPGLPLTVTRTETILSTALLRLPDPVYYVNTWREWRIRLHLGSATGGRDVTLAAPAPPPNEASRTSDVEAG